MTLKLTASTFSFDRAFQRKKMDIARYIETCARLGFTGIELNDGYLMKDSLPLREIKRRAISLGLDIAAVAIESVFVRNNRMEIKREEKNIFDWLEKAYYLGSPILRVNTGQMVNTLETLRNKKVTWEVIRGWVVEVFGRVVTRAEKLGIVIAMENHYCATRTAEETLQVINGVGSPWFRVNIDTGNFYESIHYRDDFRRNPEILTGAKPFEEVYAGIDQLARSMIYCHAKIYRLDGRNCEDLLLDYDRIFTIFRRHGYRGYISIENFSAEDPVDLLGRSARMLTEKWERCFATSAGG